VIAKSPRHYFASHPLLVVVQRATFYSRHPSVRMYAWRCVGTSLRPSRKCRRSPAATVFTARSTSSTCVARYCYCMSSVRHFVCPSATLVDCDHTLRDSRKVISRINRAILPLLASSEISKGNFVKFEGELR